MSKSVDEAASARVEQVSMGRIFHAWWPLAASWLLMAVELPMVSAVVARLPTPEISLAAWGGVVFPISLLIESPIIMLLAASTALSRNEENFRKVRRFMMWSGAALSALHIAIAFTPLYDLVVGGLIGAPPEIRDPARVGLQLMTPWTWSIAYRRFHQGLLIRFDHSDAVGIGTAIRLTADASVLGAGLLIGTIPGVVVAGVAVASGVIAEAIYAGYRARPVVAQELPQQPPPTEPLTLPDFLSFYTPLALTSLLTLLMQPMGSAALSRMPNALASLAVWPVITGLVFMARSMGMAFNEVVIAMLDERGSVRNLWRFTLILAAATTALLFVVAATPLSRFWFGVVSGLPPHLTDLATEALWFALPLPGVVVFHSWYQGALVNSRRTRGVTEAVGLELLFSAVVLAVGVAVQAVTGLIVAWIAFSLGAIGRMAWLWWRSRDTVRAVRARDDEPTLAAWDVGNW